MFLEIEGAFLGYGDDAAGADGGAWEFVSLHRCHALDLNLGVVDAFAEVFYPTLLDDGVSLDEVGHLLHGSTVLPLLVGHAREDHELRNEEDSLWCFSKALALLYLLLHLGDGFD